MCVCMYLFLSVMIEQLRSLMTTPSSQQVASEEDIKVCCQSNMRLCMPIKSPEDNDWISKGPKGYTTGIQQ